MVKAKVGKVKNKKAKTTPKKTTGKKAVANSTPEKPGIKKVYLKTRNICKVTFRLPKNAAPDAKSASIVGDFNEWNIHSDRMRKLKNGDFTIALELEPGNEYQFRYLIDETRWENDWNADKYVGSPFAGNDNSVVIV